VEVIPNELQSTCKVNLNKGSNQDLNTSLGQQITTRNSLVNLESIVKMLSCDTYLACFEGFYPNGKDDKI
jgi:hypothetical protein